MFKCIENTSSADFGFTTKAVFEKTDTEGYIFDDLTVPVVCRGQGVKLRSWTQESDDLFVGINLVDLKRPMLSVWFCIQLWLGDTLIDHSSTIYHFTETANTITLAFLKVKELNNDMQSRSLNAFTVIVTGVFVKDEVLMPLYTQPSGPVPTDFTSVCRMTACDPSTQQEHTVYLHRAHLAQRCPVLEAMLTSGMAESQAQVIKLSQPATAEQLNFLAFYIQNGTLLPNNDPSHRMFGLVIGCQYMMTDLIHLIVDKIKSGWYDDCQCSEDDVPLANVLNLFILADMHEELKTLRALMRLNFYVHREVVKKLSKFQEAMKEMLSEGQQAELNLVLDGKLEEEECMPEHEVVPVRELHVDEEEAIELALLADAAAGNGGPVAPVTLINNGGMAGVGEEGLEGVEGGAELAVGAVQPQPQVVVAATIPVVEPAVVEQPVVPLRRSTRKRHRA